MAKKSIDKLIVLFHDNLNLEHLETVSANKDTDIILMVEADKDINTVKNHKKKLVFIFSAMRHFHSLLVKQGWRVIYTKITLKSSPISYCDQITEVYKDHSIKKIVMIEPSDYSLKSEIDKLKNKKKYEVEVFSNSLFYCSRDEFSEWAAGKKQLLMENFYRQMRKMHNILMNGDKPQGGKWNFDKQNRKPPSASMKIPAIKKPAVDAITKSVIELVEKKYKHHFGDIKPFYIAVTPQGAKNVLNDFISNRLSNFGDYQDAMLTDEPFMYHSLISFYLNIGLLSPFYCVELALESYKKSNAPINAVEAFIRQIIGWREFIRGVYWLKMPKYAESNHLNATRNLPDFYWTADTDMNCIKNCVSVTKKYAYAHHIQRLMVLGNFALIAGLDPKQVNEWYHIVYLDAYQWVEMPNVSGMILYADGGVVATKPYAASGAYINKMSNYCKDCKFSVKEKSSDNACPFNSLYWHFLYKNKARLKGNHRMAMMYALLDKMDKSSLKKMLDRAENFLEDID